MEAGQAGPTELRQKRAGRVKRDANVSGGVDGGRPAGAVLTPAQAVEVAAPESRHAIDPGPIQGAVEAIVLSADRPVPSARIASAIFHARASRESQAEEPSVSPDEKAAVEAALERLNEAYDAGGRAFRIELVAGGYRVMTRPEHAEVLAAFKQSRHSSKLSRAGIETLAIIAYRQPVTRAELESIRGVSCGEVLRSLLERRLITIAGRAEELGRPMLYGTTRQFLDQFGLASLKDLPAAGDLLGAAKPTRAGSENATERSAEGTDAVGPNVGSH